MNGKHFFRRYCWFLVGYNVLVILWGAVVRATGSGAGCGSHWPLCNGEVVPQLQRIETVIELIHRITSTLDGVLVIVLVILAYRIFGQKSNIFKWAAAALIFIIFEGLLGRMLVVQEWVADNVSVMRAIAVAVHLVNTYLLLLTLTVTAWLANMQVAIKKRELRIAIYLIFIGITLTIIFSATGAITALGDTLFPAETFLSDFYKDFDPTSNFLIRLRIIHPILAIFTSGYLIFTVRFIQKKELGKNVIRRGNWLQFIIAVQVLAGGFTILTLAPIYMQIIHLFLANSFWISLILFSLEVLTIPQRVSST